jgi:hypothetical protein
MDYKVDCTIRDVMLGTLTLMLQVAVSTQTSVTESCYIPGDGNLRVKLLFTVLTLVTKCKSKIKNSLKKSNVVVEISPSQNALKSWLMC